MLRRNTLTQLTQEVVNECELKVKALRRRPRRFLKDASQFPPEHLGKTLRRLVGVEVTNVTFRGSRRPERLIVREAQNQIVKALRK